jgi:hypothetical protein
VEKRTEAFSLLALFDSFSVEHWNGGSFTPVPDYVL